MDESEISEEWTEGTKRPFAAGLSDPGERMAIFRVLDSFRQYRKETHYSTTHRRRQNFYALSHEHQELLKRPPINFLENLNKIDDAIDNNADIADDILELALRTFDLPENPETGSEIDWHNTARPLDMSKAHSTLRQFWRDWSDQGYNEELKPILDLIESSIEHVHTESSEASQRNQKDGSMAQFTSSLKEYNRILLPGAGLGRLVFELCMKGFSAEGNEISYHQLFASQFVLNAIDKANKYRLYPFVSSFNNNTSRDKQLRSVAIPDVHPGNAMAESWNRHSAGEGEAPGEMSMTAGDFITSYSSAENTDTFDVVATVFFIDTAPNVLRYLQTIMNCLRDEGIWINIGPLLWHFEDSSHSTHETDDDDNLTKASKFEDGIAEPGSFELSEDEVLQLAKWLGFELVVRQEPDSTYGGYIRDKESLMANTYRCCRWVFKKRPTQQR